MSCKNCNTGEAVSWQFGCLNLSLKDVRPEYSFECLTFESCLSWFIEWHYLICTVELEDDGI